MITQELKDRLIADYPKFEDMTHKFYKKEMSIADYKGESGAFGSYAERGANSSMSRWRFNGGRMTREHMQFWRNQFVNTIYSMCTLRLVNVYKCMVLMVIQY